MKQLAYEWKVPKDYSKTPQEDVADAYRIYQDSSEMTGIFIEALYGEDWQKNPHNTRPIIKHLLFELGHHKKK